MRGVSLGIYLLDRLRELGIEHIFGIPGDYVIRFNKEIEEHSIAFINATRENTAGYMADAYARMRGLGAACITYGVGVNIINATAQAYVEGSALVIISGAAAANEHKQSAALHHLIHEPRSGLDTTQLEIFQRVTVAQAVLSNPLCAAKQIHDVLAICLEKKKPVYIELPRDQVDVVLSDTQVPKTPKQSSDSAALKEALEEVKKLLERSERPLLWVGHELRSYQLQTPLLAFAEANHIPIVSTLLGKTVIDERHPLYVGVYQGKMSLPAICDYAHKADLCLFLGGLLTDVDTGMFTARLYEEKCISAQKGCVCIGHHSYPSVRFEDFVRGLATIKRKPYGFVIPARSAAATQKFTPRPKKAITSTRLFACLQSQLRDEHFLVTDIGDCLFGATDLVLAQDSFLACAYFTTLGFGMPGALGVQIARPERRAVALIGDGAFQMTGMELSTAVRYGLDPIVIVMNNHGYGTERPLMEGKFNDIQNWRYSKLPEVLGGGRGFYTDTEEAFDAALRQSIDLRGEYALIEVELGKTDFSFAMQRFCKLVKDRV